MTESGNQWVLHAMTPFARNVGVDEMQVALEAAGIGVWDWNIVTGEVAWSDNLERIHGLEPGSFGGSFDAYLADIHPDDRDAVLASIDRAVSQGLDHDVEYRVVLPDGQLRWVAGRGRAFVDASGRAVRMTGTCQDITGRRGAEEVYGSSRLALEVRLGELSAELERVNARLATETEARVAAEALVRQQQKMETLGRLAAGVAHDFNNLLMVVSAASELVLRQLDANDPVLPRVGEIRRAARRGAALTRRFLAFSRPAEPEVRIVDVNATIVETSAMLGRLVGDDVEILCEPDPDPCLVRIDAGHLDHMLVNLVLNARDAMPDGGRIIIETGDLDTAERVPCAGVDLDAGRYVTLSVTDTGCGMDRQTLERIFDEFFTTKAAGEGTGLGLATVHALAREAGGAIRVTSTVGLGSTFTIVLPRAASDADAEEAATRPARPGEASVVLLFESDATVRTLLREVLESAGHEVVEASDRREFMDVCRDASQAIDLIVADVPAARLGGLPLVDSARVHRPGVPAVLLTDEVLAGGFGGGLGDRVVAVSKPIGPNAFLQRVHKALDREGEL